MAMSPVFFILVALALTSAMLSAIFFMAWRTQGHKKHALTWALTFLLATVQWTINLLADSFASAEIYWLAASAFMLATVSFGMLGHCQRVESQFRLWRLWVPPVICFAVITWFTYGNPHVGLRTGLGPSYAALTLLFSAALILNHRPQSRPAEWSAAITMVIFALSQLVAAAAAYLQGPEFNQGYANIYYQVNFIAMPAAYTGMGMFVVFMLASDLSEQMKEIAIRDQLTGLLNRRGYSEAAATAYATARRTDGPVSVIVADIDRFKNINDMYGHSTGDSALCHFANLLQSGRRAEDITARIGGEEFALVLPGADVEMSLMIAENLCRQLESTPMETDLSPMAMTASFGVATISVNDTCLSDVIVRADAALYRSKRNGRNCIDLESSQLMLMPGGELKPIPA